MDDGRVLETEQQRQRQRILSAIKPEVNLVTTLGVTVPLTRSMVLPQQRVRRVELQQSVFG